MARDGLQIGMELEDEISFYPLEFGITGSIDTRNSNPGDAEEWDFSQRIALAASPAERRMSKDNVTEIRNNNPCGLPAVWATENTREALLCHETQRVLCHEWHTHKTAQFRWV